MIVDGTNVTMTRGDSESFVVIYRIGGVKVPLVTGDRVYLTIKARETDTVKALQKIVTEFVNGTAEIIINPVDTQALPFKTFVYDVQINFANGNVKTVITPSKFTIAKEVTHE